MKRSFATVSARAACGSRGTDRIVHPLKALRGKNRASPALSLSLTGVDEDVSVGAALLTMGSAGSPERLTGLVVVARLLEPPARELVLPASEVPVLPPSRALPEPPFTSVLAPPGRPPLPSTRVVPRDPVYTVAGFAEKGGGDGDAKSCSGLTPGSCTTNDGGGGLGGLVPSPVGLLETSPPVPGSDASPLPSPGDCTSRADGVVRGGRMNMGGEDGVKADGSNPIVGGADGVGGEDAATGPLGTSYRGMVL